MRHSWSQLVQQQEFDQRLPLLEKQQVQRLLAITTSGNALTLKFVTGLNVGLCAYLLESDTKYQMFKLKNQEFTFDVDMSNLPCGLNGALYFVEMDADGGMSRFPNNKAGARFGTGYCDTQCPHDIKFIGGTVCFSGLLSSPSCRLTSEQGQRRGLERYFRQLGHWFHRCLLH